MINIHELLELAIRHRASDLLLKAGSAPALRIDDHVSRPACFGGTTKRKKQGERKKCGEKAARNHYGNENRCTLIVAVAFATGESALLRTNAEPGPHASRNETHSG